jgi:hypothetical protein
MEVGNLQRVSGGKLMFDMLSTWRAGEVIGLTAVVGFFLWMIAWVVVHYWNSARLAELEAGLKRDFLQRGLSVEEIERLLRASREPASIGKPINDRELDANLASLLVQYEVSAPTIEQTMRVFQTADPAVKKPVYTAVEEMLESGAAEDQLLTAVRSLCQPRERSVVPAVG